MENSLKGRVAVIRENVSAVSDLPMLSKAAAVLGLVRETLDLLDMIAERLDQLEPYKDEDGRADG